MTTDQRSSLLLRMSEMRQAGIKYLFMYANLALLRKIRGILAPTANVLAKLSRRAGFATHFRLSKTLQRIELLLVEEERKRGLTHEWSISGTRFTASENRSWFNSHDWSQLGEEWTPSAAWKSSIARLYLEPYMSEGGVLLEIGPGGGRWTEMLLSRAQRLYLVDVAERPLILCQQRFSAERNILCVRTDGRSIPVSAESLDGIWSYDVFVHLNPVDAGRYLSEFSRVLRGGGRSYPSPWPGPDRSARCTSPLGPDRYDDGTAGWYQWLGSGAPNDRSSEHRRLPECFQETTEPLTVDTSETDATY